jgi:hypothetical protein
VVALDRITGQGLLVQFARSDPNHLIRCQAIRNLTDPAMLSKIARSEAHFLGRVAAVETLTDQAALAVLATTAQAAKEVRVTAIERLTDQAALEGIARSDDKIYVRKAAVLRLTNVALLVRRIMAEATSPTPVK